MTAVAATCSCSDSAVSHRSALVMHGLPVVGRWTGRPVLTVPPRRTGSLRDAHLHRATLWPQDVVVVGEAAVTSVARTLIDVARSCPTSTVVAALDAALHRGAVEVGALDDVVLRCWNWPGIARAHRAIRLSDGRSESPLESVSRLTIRLLRLPPPEPQVVVLDPSGRRIARLDFYWDEFGVAGEADGRSKYTDRDVLTAEKDRQEDVENLGVCFAPGVGRTSPDGRTPCAAGSSRPSRAATCATDQVFAADGRSDPREPVIRRANLIDQRPPRAGRPRAWP